MKFLVLIRIAQSVLVIAWGNEPGPGVLSRRLAALRYWPSCRRRRGVF
jgi:hypothetical protein